MVQLPMPVRGLEQFRVGRSKYKGFKRSFNCEREVQCRVRAGS